MQKFDWWKISTLALRTPVARWRLLLRCAPIPVVMALAMFATSFALRGFSWSEEVPSIFLNFLGLISSVPWLVLAWMWMNALWSGDESQITNFYLTPLFWQYLALFLLVDLATLIPDWLFGMAFGGMFTAEATGNPPVADTSETTVMFLGSLGLIGLMVWISIRLVIWGAVIVDQQRIIGPRTIWNLTRGHGVAIFMTILVIGVVTASATLILMLLVIGSTDFTNVLPILSLWSFLISVYSIAAISAATLLIYRRISGGAIPETSS